MEWLLGGVKAAIAASFVALLGEAMTDTLQEVAIIAAAILGVGVIWTKLAHPFLRFVHRGLKLVEKLGDMPERLDRFERKSDVRHRETQRTLGDLDGRMHDVEEKRSADREDHRAAHAEMLGLIGGLTTSVEALQQERRPERPDQAA